MPSPNEKNREGSEPLFSYKQSMTKIVTNFSKTHVKKDDETTTAKQEANETKPKTRNSRRSEICGPQSQNVTVANLPQQNKEQNKKSASPQKSDSIKNNQDRSSPPKREIAENKQSQMKRADCPKSSIDHN